MPKFAANLSLMFTEHALLDRFAAASRSGFAACELLPSYEVGASALRDALQAANMRCVLHSAPPGGRAGEAASFATAWSKGERGIAALPRREADFAASLDVAITYAKALGTQQLHVMAGCIPASATQAERNAMRRTYLQNLRLAAERFAEHNITALIEPINTRDVPGYFLNRQDHAHEIVNEVNHSHLKVQMDVYHCQIVEGDVAMKLKQYLPTGKVAHIQIASVPERNEPDEGELNYTYLFKLIDELGYSGWVGCEYRPKADTVKGLGWFADNIHSQVA
jgi:2-dehydrotetronate isomerase